MTTERVQHSDADPTGANGNDTAEFWLDPEDLQWLVYAAGAFNDGHKASAERTSADVEDLWDRIERVGAAVGIKVNRGVHPDRSQEAHDG